MKQTIRTRIRVAVLLVSVEAGCAGSTWLKPGSTNQQLAADRGFCVAKSDRWAVAGAGAGNASPGYALIGILVANHDFNSCMKELGWNQPGDIHGKATASDYSRSHQTEGREGVTASDSEYANEIMGVFASIEKQMNSMLPKTPFCALPGYGANDLTILRTSNYTARYGFRVGDKYLAFDESPVYTQADVLGELFARNPGDVIVVAIERNNTKLDVTVECADGFPIAKEMIAALNAGSQGRWSDCAFHTNNFEQLTVVASVTAELRLLCSEAGRISHGRQPSIGEAELTYEASRLFLEEAQVQPGGLAKVRGRLLARISWLDGNGYPVLAEDLRASLDRATNPLGE